MNRPLSRRNFIKLTGAAALGLGLPSAARTQAARPLPPDDLSQLEAILVGRVTTDYLRVYQRPTFDSQQIGWRGYDDVLPVYREIQGESWRGHPNQTWYEIEGGYVYSMEVQPTTPASNLVVTSFPSSGLGYVGEVTVPYTDAIWKPDNPNAFAYRLYYDSVYWVTDLVHNPEGAPLYDLYDERLGIHYYAPAEHMRIVPEEALAPISPDVGDKRIVVDLQVPQRLTAYEGNAEVFSTLISGGRYRFAEDIAERGGPPTLTPEGRFRIERKKPSRHMGAGEFASDYELPGVGWVSYIHWRGYAFHSTYWHNDYGHPRSAGCINMKLEAARWLFRWSQPIAPYGEELVKGAGTRVEID